MVNEIEGRNCCGKHLVFGRFISGKPSPLQRCLIICGALIMEIAMTGACYWTQYETGENFENEFALDNIDWMREGGIGGACALAGIFISAFLTIIHGKASSLGIFISSLFVIVSTAIVCYLSAVFNQIWSLTWMFSWLISALAEILLGQTILMCIAASVFKIKTQPS